MLIVAFNVYALVSDSSVFCTEQVVVQVRCEETHFRLWDFKTVWNADHETLEKIIQKCHESVCEEFIHQCLFYVRIIYMCKQCVCAGACTHVSVMTLIMCTVQKSLCVGLHKTLKRTLCLISLRYRQTRCNQDSKHE